MTTVPTPDGGALISRPELSAAALKAALAIVSPNQLPRMLEDEAKAVTETFRTDDTTHVRAFLMHWATVVEIERFPDRARSYHQAEYEAHNATTVDECRKYASIVGDIWRTCFAAVSK
ncbi:hypothetical protein [Streptacidiphilus fuscans]|uniref:Uncharacterized protein n=1 Tax=Streptacidiphilus fuscans TaxID=2789292 RepID=A0A931BBI2_9ACTN|nr:hypothetical protein [Streptacidiphilus fuscans]MBF9071198.1 hypothetical protein [Streptacidiphilus fuscans]